MTSDDYHIYALAENTLTVQMKPVISKEQIRSLHSLRSKILDHDQPAIQQVIVTFHELSVFYNSSVLSFEALRELIRTCLSSKSKTSDHQFFHPKKYFLPVCYDDEMAWDKTRLESHSGLSFNDMIKLHSSTVYTFFMMGFLPGFLYMGGLADELACPRLEKPRQKVIKGSVGIAGQQTGVYPMDSPGGWNIIGRTPLNLFDYQNTELNNINNQIIHPLDEVEFKPVSYATYQELLELPLMEYQQTILND